MSAGSEARGGYKLMSQNRVLNVLHSLGAGGGEDLGPVLGDEDVVLDPGAEAAPPGCAVLAAGGGDVEAGLHRDHHPRLQRPPLVRPPAVVHVHTLTTAFL